jgi:hypothetical protein
LSDPPSQPAPHAPSGQARAGGKYGRLRELDFEHIRPDEPLIDVSGDCANQAVTLEVQGRGVERDRQRRVDGVKDGEIHHELLQHGRRDFSDESGRFRQRNEGVRADQAAVLMVPTNQRFRACDGAEHHGDLRLVVEYQLTAT